MELTEPVVELDKIKARLHSSFSQIELDVWVWLQDVA
jgi:hypothetical protein